MDRLRRGRHSITACGARCRCRCAVEDGIIGALNLYSRSPHAFADNEQMATVFVAHAAAALANAQAYSAAQALSEQLRTALDSRAVIEQAKGVLMRDHQCDAEEAFEMLKHASQHTNRKLRDVAATIVNDAVNGGQRAASE